MVTKAVPAGVTAVETLLAIFIKIHRKKKDEERRRDYAQSIGFAPYATTADQSDPILEGMRVLLDRIQHNETRMNNLCQRLSELDPSFKKKVRMNSLLVMKN